MLIFLWFWFQVLSEISSIKTLALITLKKFDKLMFCKLSVVYQAGYLESEILLSVIKLLEKMMIKECNTFWITTNRLHV